MRLAWFSPLPPDRSGIAAYSAELLPRLAERGHLIDAYPESAAHQFVWHHRRQPYDLTVYQLGNAACHDYMWAYLFRYPGLLVLHDAQLHQARALALTKRWEPRREDYLAEFRANHPDAPPEVGEVVAAGIGEAVFHLWPHIRLVVESARVTAVHNPRLAVDLAQRYPAARLATVRMGVADPLEQPSAEPAAIRRAHGIPDEAFVVGTFGGITPEKRIEAILSAVSALAGRHPALHVMLVGAAADHYAIDAEIQRWGLEDRVHVTGYVPEDEVGAYLLAADVWACLRWPTNRETSASWLRCLAAGRPTLITDLADLVDVPTLDPRTWAVLDAAPRGAAADAATAGRPAVAISIDVVDEGHSLRLALDRLIADRTLASRLGAAARAWWASHHQLEAMAADYDALLTTAVQHAIPTPILPSHLTDDGSARAHALADDLGVEALLADVLDR